MPSRIWHQNKTRERDIAHRSHPAEELVSRSLNHGSFQSRRSTPASSPLLLYLNRSTVLLVIFGQNWRSAVLVALQIVPTHRPVLSALRSEQTEWEL